MKPVEIRKRFISFFEKQQHTAVKSSALIPAEDPTILFANAGMNQFKDLFLGRESRSYKRATSVQKCVRAGGKHNDLDEVGFTDRHLTFFEMLGNFSFGDYFKKEAIQLAWDFLTKELGILPEKLSVTVHTSDEEAADIWHNMIGLPKDRITYLGDEDNFWQMGDVGPCGPCSEIFYDRGAEFEDKEVAGRTTTRYVEIWNLVFMQFGQSADGTRKPLTQTGVDTGMGLERLCMVMEGAELFESSTFGPYIQHIESKTGVTYKGSPIEVKAAFNVLSDHIRSASLLIADGGTPSNEGRGYVLRKIIRRAALFGKKLSDDTSLFASLIPVLFADMGDAYPELKANEQIITTTINQEVERFSDNLTRGKRFYEAFVSKAKKAGKTELSGPNIFKLYDTYGFPPELTRAMAIESDMTLDMNGFDKEMKQQKKQSNAGPKKDTTLELPDGLATTFTGQTSLSETSNVLWSGKDTNGNTIFCPAVTALYPEGGGQISDSGTVTIDGKDFPVLDVQKYAQGGKTAAIIITISGKANLTEKTTVTMTVAKQLRLDTQRNHTGTHLLQAALIKVLGNNVKQAGSLVHPDYLRFDFSFPGALTKEQIKTIEQVANAWIVQAASTEISTTTLSDAQDRGAMAFFGEKYNPENVRVVDVPGISIELCGGTHVSNIGEIGLLKIVADEALGVGVRRITALTGPKAIESYQQTFAIAEQLNTKFAVKTTGIMAALEKEQEKTAELRKAHKQTKKQLLNLQIPTWIDGMETVGSNSFLFLELIGAAAEDMRDICQRTAQAKPASLSVIISKTNNDEKVSFIAWLGKDIDAQYNLKDLSGIMAKHGLRGGGKKNSMQGGGMLKDAGALKKAIIDWLC